MAEIRSWFMKLVAGRASAREEAQVVGGDGHVVFKVVPAAPLATPQAQQDFEANARMAAAGLRMYHAMQRVVADAIDAGLPNNAASIREAYAAMEAARPPKFDVMFEGRQRFTGTQDECCAYVVRASGMSFQGATEVGGYLLRSVGLRPLSDEERADVAEGIMAEEERRMERASFAR